ncbi:WXG100 family type VII secretion target [Paractinoplanes rhizophilus]|uniref:WXG100 family type VII secretion target n=1 Tax=Paractinoplanes rhizophilus TaxID=1416877 RepID=A0ABW2HXI8_9ACTN|nr:WXG100 family type VII secretion target [Actinoplanes sp.]
MTIGNPLVATASSAPVDPWAGVWIAEDIELIASGVRNGSWIDAGLGGVSAGLDALAVISDPIGALLQYGVAWIIEHVKPLAEALDWLAGDPAQIAAHAQTWRNVAGALHERAADLGRCASQDTIEWTGTAGDAYRDWSAQQRAAIDGLAEAAEAMAVMVDASGALIAGVRVLVRDAIATLVSHLISYAAEALLSLGAATGLIVEQVATLCASWAARIAGWLRNLVHSLSRLHGAGDQIAKFIEWLKEILGRLAGRFGGKRGRPSERRRRQALIDELERAGIKHNPDDILEIGRDASGRILFLEKGNSRAGMQHILERHGQDFTNVGVPEDKVGRLVFEAVTSGQVVGTEGRRSPRNVYEVVFEGRTYRLAVTVGSNGFIVGANPVGR